MGQDAAKSSPRSIAGVPIGGIGAGCIELGIDGRFRNITINNNRSADTRIAQVPGSFLAVRGVVKGKLQTRILQSSTGLPWDAASLAPQHTPTEQLSWRGLYPIASYALTDPTFPFEVRWRYFAPILPFDTEASSLPVMILQMTVRNNADTMTQASTLLNWENICGCTATEWPAERGAMQPLSFHLSDRVEGEADTAITAGLEFGMRGKYPTNAYGEYCVAVKPRRSLAISVMGWDSAKAGDLEEMWNRFAYEGDLGEFEKKPLSAHQGAVCCSFDLMPKTEETVTYVIAWHCPRFEANGVDLGNRYTAKFKTARDAAGHAQHYSDYFAKAVTNWQDKLLKSTLPRWMPRMLINSLSVLSTNSVFARDGRFSMMESPEDPAMGALTRRLPGSIGTLLFYPDLEARELSLFTTDPETPGRLYDRLGVLSLDEPRHGERGAPLVDAGPLYVLMVYRHYAMTGKRLALEHLFERMTEVMRHTFSLDRNGDGLPDHDGCSTMYTDWAMFGANSYASSLWIAAIRAYVRMARKLKKEREAEQYDAVLERAIQSFNKLLWNEDAGCYRFYANTGAGDDHPQQHDGCHDGQLAGEWFAAFADLGHLMPPKRVIAALDTMRKLNDTGNGVARGVMPNGESWINPPGYPPPHGANNAWPGYAAAYYASLQIQNGRSDRGLYALQKMHENIHIKGGRAFNQPLQWDIELNKPVGRGNDRHMSAPAVWHVLFALQGFLLDVAEKTLWIRPHLPLKVHNLESPVFTPLCLGWLQFKDTPNRPYQQRIQLSFDSPVPVEGIVVGIPNAVERVVVSVENDGNNEEVEVCTGYDGDDKLVEIVPKNLLNVQQGLKITLEEVGAESSAQT